MSKIAPEDRVYILWIKDTGDMIFGKIKDLFNGNFKARLKNFAKHHNKEKFELEHKHRVIGVYDYTKDELKLNLEDILK